MKKLVWILMVVGLISVPSFSRAAQTAQARMFCLSLRFQRATTHDNNGFLWRMDLTTLSAGVNGELALNFFSNSTNTHSSYIELYNDLYDETGQGALTMNVPNGPDSNDNGFGDFWDASKAVNGLTTSGVIQCNAYYINSPLTVTWYRDAGSATGLCALEFQDPFNFLNTLRFEHTFQLIEYKGTVSYTPGTNEVTGSVHLAQTGNEANTFDGPFVFMKSISNPTDELTLQPGAWTNASSQALTFMTDTYHRDAPWLTNSYGYFDFDDGDPNTTDADYFTWILSIDDTNDFNGNGIPDFSDNPQVVTPPTPPVIKLELHPTSVGFAIQGNIGHTLKIQEIDSLSSTNWKTVLTTNITLDPQPVSLPRPSGEIKFWRAVVE